MSGAENYDTADWVLSWDELLVRGKKRLADDPDAVNRTAGAITPDTLATLIYTSGTTGTPKGVMISHRNVVWTAECLRRAANIDLGPRMVSYLPLAHIAERLATHYLATYLAGQVWFCPNLAGVLEYIQEARRHSSSEFPGYSRSSTPGSPPVSPRPMGSRRPCSTGPSRQPEACPGRAGGNIGADAGGSSRLARPVQGARAAGAGPSRPRNHSRRTDQPRPDLVLSDTGHSPVRVVRDVGDHRSGYDQPSRGLPPRLGGEALPGVEVELAEDDELLMRGGVITQGYYKLPSDTAEAFDAEGWLHSGDLARIDDDGFVWIVGRKKEIIITAGGKNVAPAKLETVLGNHPLISKACMVGDGRKFLTMIVALDHEEAPAWAEANGLVYQDLATFSQLPEVNSEIERAVDEANDTVSSVEQVKKWIIVPDEWTPDSGEVTPSLKLKRKVVLDKYASEIESLYVESETRPRGDMERDLFEADHELFRSTAREFVEREVAPNVAKWEAEGKVDKDMFRKAGKARASRDGFA